MAAIPVCLALCSSVEGLPDHTQIPDNDDMNDSMTPQIHSNKTRSLFAQPASIRSRLKSLLIACLALLLIAGHAMTSVTNAVEVDFAASDGQTGSNNKIGNGGSPALATYRWNFGFQTGNSTIITASTFVITLNPPNSDPGGTVKVTLYSGLGGSLGSGTALASSTLTYNQIKAMPAAGSGFFDTQFKLTNFSASINNPNPQGYYSFQLDAIGVTGQPYGSKMQPLSASGSGIYVVTGSVGGDTSSSTPSLVASPITGVTVQPAPEPSTTILAMMSAMLLAAIARKRSSKQTNVTSSLQTI